MEVDDFTHMNQQEEMDQLTYLIKKMNLHVLSVGEIPESISSGKSRS